MIAPIHVTGAGVVGCILMEHLSQAGIDFTWSDAETGVIAWKACTGSVCPDDKDPAGVWEAWEQFVVEALEGRYTERTAYYKWARDIGWFKAGQSWHMNVQEFVPATRVKFADRRSPEATFDQVEIQTVGHVNCKTWWWGWSVIAAIPGLERACWSMRCVRQIRYIYPRPGSEHFYVGSSIQSQQTPRNLDTDKHVAWWMRNWAENAKVPEMEFLSDPVEGWRPVGMPGKWTALPEGNIVIAPQSASGVKFSPFVAQQIVKHLQKENGL